MPESESPQKFHARIGSMSKEERREGLEPASLHAVRAYDICFLIADAVPQEVKEAVVNRAFKLLKEFRLTDQETYDGIMAKVKGIMDGSQSDPDISDDEAAILALAKSVREAEDGYRAAVGDVLGEAA